MSFLQLPSECILSVLKRLPVAEVVAMASCCSALRQLAQDDCFWADLAEAKWGTAARDLKPISEQQPEDNDANEGSKGALAATAPSAGLGSWQRYCYKRMSARTIKPSPLNLLQESYPDPWQHIICCVLCSRTSGSELIRTAIAAFFQTLPTPTAVLEADGELLKELLHPLGLQASRMAAVKSVSHGFLATDWQTPAEFHGCGKFVEDSWRIFCRGDRDSQGVGDANLKAYLAWHSRQGPSTVTNSSAKQRGKQRKQSILQPKRKAEDTKTCHRQHVHACPDLAAPTAQRRSSRATAREQDAAAFDATAVALDDTKRMTRSCNKLGCSTSAQLLIPQQQQAHQNSQRRGRRPQPL